MNVVGARSFRGKIQALAHVLCFFVLGATAIAFADMGPAALVSPDDLPLAREGVWLVGTDSHDVTGDNDDGFNAAYSYLYKDGDEWVLFEEEGPGCVYVVRTIRHKGDLRIYLDGAKDPSYTIPFKDLYAGKTPPFVPPFAGDEDIAHGSSWSYVPIPFARGCRLTTTEMEKPHFLNIFAHRFASGTVVNSFDPARNLDDAAAWWSDPARTPEARGETATGSLSIAPTGTASLVDITGAGAITGLRLRFKDGGIQPAADLVLRAYWDGREAPHIDSPVSTFFALGCPRAVKALVSPDLQPFDTERYVAGTVRPESLFVGQDEDGWLYCRFPMPYWTSARIELLNESSTDTIEVEYAMTRSNEAYPQSACYFNAQWRSETPLRDGEDYCVLDTRGRGHYVGCVMTFSSVHFSRPSNRMVHRGYLEGDARYYTDGNRTPFVACTGTEEYFNWGWYDMKPMDAVFTYPTHGYPLHLCCREDYSVMYRFHVGEVAPYYRSFRFDLEHGPIGRIPAHYSGTAFFYQRDESVLTLTDELDVGDAGSEQAHGYACTDATGEDSHTLPYEGSYQLALQDDAPRDRDHAFKDSGRVWTGSSRLTVRVAPENAGVKLRRRSYYAFGAKGPLGGGRPEPVLTPAQRVRVTVDGEDAGSWSIPAGHARDTWRDTEFELPARLTAGKERITITLTAEAGTAWDEYTYWVYSYAS